MGTINAKSANLGDMQAAVTQAAEGDTIIVPATDANGVSWTGTLTINKSISIMGKTTCETASQYGSVTSSAETIVKDDVVNRLPLLKFFVTNPNVAVNFSGFTFRYGGLTGVAQNSVVLVSGLCNNFHMFNHHFDQLYGPHLSFGGDLRGVMDHCFFDFRKQTSEGIYVHHDTWLGIGDFGDNSYTDKVHWGTDKFLFIEDCCLNNRSPDGDMMHGNTDSEGGGRVVFRHNHCNNNVGLSGHGTDTGGRLRGMRAAEYYANQIEMDSTVTVRRFTEHRSGSTLSFNNVMHSTPTSGTMTPRQCRYYRYFGGSTLFAGAGSPCSGSTTDWYNNPPTPERNWDTLATNSGGTWVAGQPPFNFESGVATNPPPAPGNAPIQKRLEDSTKNWTPGQWIGYTVVNWNYRIKDNTGTWPYNAQIIDNDAHSLTTSNQQFDGPPPPNITFKSGDHYVIRKVLIGLDQQGYYSPDLIRSVVPPVLNSSGLVATVSQVKEGMFAWGNTFNGSPFTLLITDMPKLLVEGTTPGTGLFYNRAPQKLELQTMSPTTPDSAFDGSGNYVGYQYPHPLNSGGVTTPSIITPDSLNFQEGVSGTSYTLATQGFSGTPTFSIESGSLPTGVTLTSGGVLSGTPATGTAGSSPYNVTFKAVHLTETASRLYHVNVGIAVTKVISLTGNMAFGDVTINTTKTSNLSITNNGNTVLTVSGITGPTGYSFSWTSGAIQPGATQTSIVTFAPTSGGNANGTITVASDKTSGTNTIAVSGFGATRVMAFSATSVAFGNITIGQSATIKVILSNNGNRAINISGITYPQDVDGSLTVTSSIPAGTNATLSIVFTPSLAQSYSGDIVISSDATSGPSKITMTGTGVTLTTRIIELNSPLDFGNVQVGTSLNRTLTITNSGNGSLTVTGISLPTGYSGSFSGTISSGASQNVTITFSPTSAISYNGTLTVTSNASGGTNTAALTGSGFATATRILTVSGDMSFGNVSIGTNSVHQLILGNTGSADLTIIGITPPTGFTGSFSGNINPGGTVSIPITFAPIDASSYDGTIAINSNATSGPSSVAVTGSGVVPTTRIIGITGNLAFGNVQKNHNASRVMKITNTGTNVLTVSDITVPTGFFVNWSSGDIQPGATQAVTVTFKPTALITYGGVITVVSNKTTGTNTINCSGTGVGKKQVPFILQVV